MAGYGSFYWAERTARSRRTAYPTYRGQHEFDVVVIGGGLTGCTAVYVFANAGLSVALVEADRLASRSTAASLGALLPQPDATFRAVEATAGLRVARTAWKTSRKSVLEFAAALKKLKIKCDLDASALVVTARTSDAADQLRREQSARNAAGVDVPWLAARIAARQLGTESAGAIKDARGVRVRSGSRRARSGCGRGREGRERLREICGQAHALQPQARGRRAVDGNHSRQERLRRDGRPR